MGLAQKLPISPLDDESKLQHWLLPLLPELTTVTLSTIIVGIHT